MAGTPRGRLFIEERCITCMVCVEIAPEIFLADATQERVFVGRQPRRREEIDRCREAAAICPVDAITGIELPVASVS